MTPRSNLGTILGSAAISLRAGWASFDGNEQIAEHIADAGEDMQAKFEGATWRVATHVDEVNEGFEVRLRFVVEEGNASSVGVAAIFEFGRWSTTNYLLMPAAAYNGNRFHSVPSNEVEKFVGTPSAVMPLTITDQQRLAISPGPSRLDFRSGDLATPAVAIHFPAENLGFIVLTDQGTQAGDTGIVFEESLDRSRATLRFTAPCVRSGDRGRKRGDRGAKFAPGDTVELRLRIHVFHAGTINALFEKYFVRRNDLRVTRWQHEIPFSSCWQIQQEKYNRQNWVESIGYYSVGMRESAWQDWQTAWVGGMNTVYALLCAGDVITRQRAARTFDFLFAGGQFPTGFFREVCYEGTWGNGGNTLQRYSADALLFLMKEYLLLEARSEVVQPHWKVGARRCADAFVKLWNTQGSFGHRLDDGGVITFGGTCSASTACAGLALAARYFRDTRYLVVAQAAAEHYHREYVSRGITNGGPGDIIQCPDSESAAGLLESFTTLFEETGERRWMEYARDAAHHCATWTMSYDFVFPAASTFGQLGMLTTGTVFANVQNKHSAPGICSLSGVSLFKLFRATGDVRYLKLLREIAHAIPQYMSRADRMISDVRPGQRWPVMDPGWINERVNTSDWEVRADPDNEIGVGEIFGGSTWAEVAMMLTWAEVPGIYWQVDTGFVIAIDHVDVRIIVKDGVPALEVNNPTKFHASVKLLCEATTDLSRPLGPLVLHDAPRIEVLPGATIVHVLEG